MNEYSAKTVEEAIEAGLTELGLTREQVEIEVVDEGSKGFLGLGGKKAVVRITKKVATAEDAGKFIDGLLKLMDITATTETTETDEKITINLITTNSSAVIGYRGEVLDALQCLAGAVANTGREDYKRTVVDCEGYREKREETLKNLAVKLAEKAVKTGRKVTLEPMNPFERRIIHSTLSDREDVTTHSEGKEPNRYIAIVPANMKAYDNDKKGYRHGDRRKDGGKGEHGQRRDFKKSSDRPAKKTGWGGTFLGNSLKDPTLVDNKTDNTEE